MTMPIHYLVSLKMKNADVNVLYTLSVVHAQSRIFVLLYLAGNFVDIYLYISTLGRMMFSTLDQISLAVISIVLLNVGKFFFRLSAPQRYNLAFLPNHYI